MTSATPKPGLPRNVLAFTAVSFFNDVASDMIYPLIPDFRTRLAEG